MGMFGTQTKKQIRKKVRKALPKARAFICLVQHEDHSLSLYSETSLCVENDVRDDVLLKTKEFANCAGDLMQKIVEENIQKAMVAEFKAKRSEELKKNNV